MKGCDYCKMCYRKQSEKDKKQGKKKQGKKSAFAERKKKCNSSRLGCPICKEHICDDCWKSGYDKHL